MFTCLYVVGYERVLTYFYIHEFIYVCVVLILCTCYECMYAFTYIFRIYAVIVFVVVRVY